MIIINPQYWGNSLWKILFLFSQQPNISTKVENFKHLLTILGDFLPCSICKEHYKKYILVNPIRIIRNKYDLVLWIKNLQQDIEKQKQMGKTSSVEFPQKKYIKQTGTLTVQKKSRDVKPYVNSCSKCNEAKYNKLF